MIDPREDRTLFDIFRTCDLVLLDNSFLSIDTNLSADLFDAYTSEKLDSLASRISLEISYQQWILHNILPRRQIHTIYQIVEELSGLENHLNSLVTHHLKQTTSKFQQYHRSYYRNGHPTQGYCRRRNLKVDKQKTSHNQDDDLRYNHHSDKDNIGLEKLISFQRTATSLIRSLPIYEGQIIPFHFEISGASETDYALVGAAFGEVQRNIYHKAAILTKDHHISQIYQAQIKNQVDATKQQELQRKVLIYNPVFVNSSPS